MFSSCVLSRFLVAAIFSTLASVLLLGATQAQTAKGKKYALLVGVTEYDHASLPTLKYTENDVEELATILHDADFTSIRVLSVSRGKKDKRDSPTTANITRALDDLLAKPTKHDTVLIALAGHGVTLEVPDPDEKKPGKTHSYFCPADAHFRNVSYSTGKGPRLILMPALMKDLGDSGAGAKLILVDACRNEPKADSSAAASPPATHPAQGDGGAVQLQARRACLGDGGKAKHGVFFHFVLEGLRARRGTRQRGDLGQACRNTSSGSSDGADTDGGGPARRRTAIGPCAGRFPGAAKPPDDPKRTEVVKGWPKEIDNSIGMKLVRIPTGKFTMGSPNGEKNRSEDEEQHEVEITKEFWLGIHEVTQKEFKAVMGYNPSYFSKDGEGKTGVTYITKPAGGKDKVPADTSGFPVENVSHEEAEEFCKKLTAKEAKSGRKYRLPTEAEWEYACRGGAASSTPFHFGDTLSSSQANFNGNYPYGGADKGEYLRTCKVGSYKKNGFGLYDMHGNVWEWCADWYSKDYYSKSPAKDPPGPGGLGPGEPGRQLDLPRPGLPVGEPRRGLAGQPVQLPGLPGCPSSVQVRKGWLGRGGARNVGRRAWGIGFRGTHPCAASRSREVSLTCRAPRVEET